MRALISLTDEQRVVLDPFFKLASGRGKTGVACAIGAQVFPDGINVKLFSGEQARTLADALGGDISKTVLSARQNHEEGLAREESTGNGATADYEALQARVAEQSALINACANDLRAAQQMLERHGVTPYFLQDRLADIAARTQH